MTPLTVSVAMATYNGAPFIEEQLQSIADQTVLPLEIVLCDDGSTDATLEIAQRFAERAPFAVHIHRNPQNLGFIRNFRKAASLCRGDLIAFCDQDDWWCPDRIETCLPQFHDPELLLLYHNAWVVDESRQRNGHFYDKEAEQRALALKPLGPWNFSYGLVQIFRAELRQFDDLWDQSVDQWLGTDDILAHDQWYFFLAQALGRAEFLDEKLLEYRQHGSNMFGAASMQPVAENRLLARFQHLGRQDLLFANAAAARATILREVAERRPERREYLLGIAGRYQLLAERNQRRYRTYAGPNFAARLLSLATSWRRGDYSDWPWGFDPRSVVRDLFSGVIKAQV